MASEQAERNDVEGEPGRGPRRPQRRGLLGRQRIVGGVHLHQGELAGVMRSRSSGVSASGGYQPDSSSVRSVHDAVPTRT